MKPISLSCDDASHIIEARLSDAIVESVKFAHNTGLFHVWVLKVSLLGIEKEAATKI